MTTAYTCEPCDGERDENASIPSRMQFKAVGTGCFGFNGGRLQPASVSGALATKIMHWQRSSDLHAMLCYAQTATGVGCGWLWAEDTVTHEGASSQRCPNIESRAVFV